MRKSYLTVIILAFAAAFFYCLQGCQGSEGEQTNPKFYKLAEKVIDDGCGSSGEIFRYNQVSRRNNPVTVVITSSGYCPIKLITDQPGGTGRVERIVVASDKSVFAEIPEKTGVVTFDVLVDGLMIFSYECEPGPVGQGCEGKIVIYENFYIKNPEQQRITDSISALVSIASAHGCGNYDKYIFEYINTSSQTQYIKLEAVPNDRLFPEHKSILPYPPQWYGYVCYVRFWGFCVPPTGTVMDSIFVNGIPSKTDVEIPGRRKFYLKASCLQNPQFPDTTGSLCKGDVKITIEQ